MSVINDAQTNRTVYVRSNFCLNTAQYIHIVEYSECFITVLEKLVRISGVCVHTGI